MKRTLFITIGAIALLLIFALWLYLLLFGTPRSVSEVVGDFGFGNNVTVTPITPSEVTNDDTTRQIDLSTAGSLYQLTSKPVAGFGIVNSADGPRVLYAERGTGHVYEIDVVSGQETRLSQKTFVAITRAYFAKDGSAAVLVGETTDGSVTHLETLGTENTVSEFPEKADNIAFSKERQINYTVTSTNGTTGYSYNLGSAITKQLFGIPLKDTRVIWSADGPLIYSRTAPTLTGRLYRATDNTLTPVGSPDNAFSAMASTDFSGLIIKTSAYNNAGNLVSYASMGNASDISLGITALPEKCAFDPTSMTTIWCTSPVGLITPKGQADWYKGMVSFVDSLWRIDLANDGSAVQVDNFQATSGRQIDAMDLQMDDVGNHLLFKNKNDDTLWLKKLETKTTNASSSTTDEELLSDSE